MFLMHFSQWQNFTEEETALDLLDQYFITWKKSDGNYIELLPSPILSIKLNLFVMHFQVIINKNLSIWETIQIHIAYWSFGNSQHFQKEINIVANKLTRFVFTA